MTTKKPARSRRAIDPLAARAKRDKLPPNVDPKWFYALKPRTRRLALDLWALKGVF